MNPQQILTTLIRTRLLHSFKKKKRLKHITTFTIPEVALDIFLLVAKKQKVTAECSYLKIACFMTVSFRAS